MSPLNVGDQAPDFDHARRRADRPENLAVRAADRFPVGDIRDVDAGTHDIAQLGAGVAQGGGNVRQGLAM